MGTKGGWWPGKEADEQPSHSVSWARRRAASRAESRTGSQCQPRGTVASCPASQTSGHEAEGDEPPRKRAKVSETAKGEPTQADRSQP